MLSLSSDQRMSLKEKKKSRSHEHFQLLKRRAFCFLISRHNSERKTSFPVNGDKEAATNYWNDSMLQIVPSEQPRIPKESP